MKLRRTTTLAGAAVVGLVVAAMPLLAAGSASAATNPPWEPDPNSIGSITLYNTAGAVVTGGSDLSHLADYALASSAGDAGATKATLIFAAPDHTKATGRWFTGEASGSTNYPATGAPSSIANSATPDVTLTAADANLAAFMQTSTPDSTAGYANVYQLRIEDSGPSGVTSAPKYWSLDVQVDPTKGTWTTSVGGTAAANPPVLKQTNKNATITFTVTTLAAYKGDTVYFFRRSGLTGMVVPFGHVTVGSDGIATHYFNAKHGQILAIYSKVSGPPAAVAYSNTISFKVS